MNRQRRRELQKVAMLLGSARALLETVTDEEQEAYDNMPEGLQYSDRGEAMSEGLDSLAEMLDSLEEMDSTLCDIYGDFQRITREELTALI